MDNEILVRNPATGEFVKDILGGTLRLPVDDKSKIEECASIARKAQIEWANVPPEERLGLFKKLKRRIQRGSEEFVSTIQEETGKTWFDAMLDVVSAAAEIWTIEKLWRKAFYEKADGHFLLNGESGGVEWRDPYQLVGIISPWNLPLAIPAADIFPAIFDGSAVILKPSEYTPLTALVLQIAMIEIGFPRGLLGVALGYGESGSALCETVDYVSFTGSCRTGEKVRAACSRRNIPFNLEMGGKAPAIVLADADIERTAYALVYGGLSNSGQYCKSFERIYVQKNIFDRLFSRVLEIVKGLEPGKDYGPMITGFQFEIAKNQVQQALSKGAELCGYVMPRNLRGNWLSPVVLYPANHDMAVMKEETFGPVLPFMTFDTEEEAVSLANDSHLGLNASVFTRDEKNFYRIARQIQAGNIVANPMVNWLLPISQCGRKGSTNEICGMPRHGITGIRRFLKPKSIVWHDHSLMHLPFFRYKEPWWMPYDWKTKPALKAFLRAF